MADDDLRLAQQRGKLRGVALIVEDRAFQRRLDLGKYPRSDTGGEMAEKQGFHVFPSPTQTFRHDCGGSVSHGNGIEAAPSGHQRTV